MSPSPFLSMMEQPQAGEGHDHAVFVRRLDHIDRPGWSRPAPRCSETPLLLARSTLSPKGKKASEPTVTPVWVCDPGFLFLRGQGLGLHLEDLLPHALWPGRPRIHRRDRYRWRCPGRGGGSRPRTADPGSWDAGGDTSCRPCCPARRVQWMRLCWPAPTPMAWPSFTIADRVGLGVFQGNQGHDHVDGRRSPAVPCSW